MATKKRRSRKRKAEPALELEAPPDPDSYDGWEGSLTPKEKRVEEIISKMMQGAWLMGVSDRALAKEWNVAPSTVRNYSAEASRVVRMRLRDDPKAQAEARAQLLQLFEVIRAKAMAKGDPASLRVALDASRAYGFYLGIEPAKQLDVTQRQDPFHGWTTEEKLAFSRDGLRPRRAANAVMAGAMKNGKAHDPDDTH